MLVWRIVTVVELLVFAILVAFILLRPADATGVDNSLTMQLISLGLIAFLYLLFLIGQVIWYIILKTKKSSTSL
ncbi:DUF3923 family protein [Streptococcus raffinosi]|uniref:DUF3923 family protein n=1 Tax=Streptococcus raffinosi TaxID=3053355 RepID=A0ABT7LSX4_9STRE|nr:MULTISPECIES: DUF3923 family protein [unclassified Streptococcus]MDL5043744.1 DUF3923 family protein [Streptococcus sp. VTCC 12812]MDM0095058.1 DUF3923 family protein [Streptococcus sp. VTCC 12813]